MTNTLYIMYVWTTRSLTPSKKNSFFIQLVPYYYTCMVCITMTSVHSTNYVQFFPILILMQIMLDAKVECNGDKRFGEGSWGLKFWAIHCFLIKGRVVRGFVLKMWSYKWKTLSKESKEWGNHFHTPVHSLKI